MKFITCQSGKSHNCCKDKGLQLSAKRCVLCFHEVNITYVTFFLTTYLQHHNSDYKKSSFISHTHIIFQFCLLLGVQLYRGSTENSSYINMFYVMFHFNQVYVQHLLEEDRSLIYRYIAKDQGHFYVCGEAGMASDVRTTLKNILQQCGGMLQDDVDIYLETMKVSRITPYS